MDTIEPGEGGGLMALRRALRDREVLRWLTLLQAVDLLMDVFHGLLALYLVDVSGQGPVEAALAVSVWTGAGLAGDLALVGLLGRVDSHAYLRVSALATILCYPAFLLTHSAGAQLALLAALGLFNSGWYALPKAGLYGALPGRSGTAIAVAGVGGFVSAGIPAALGFMAEQIGLESTMWALLLAPVALLVLTPRAVRST